MDLFAMFIGYFTIGALIGAVLTLIFLKVKDAFAGNWGAIFCWAFVAVFWLAVFFRWNDFPGS